MGSLRQSPTPNATKLSDSAPGTAAASHDTGTTLYLCPRKWEIVGWRPEPDQWKLRYRLQEMPAHVDSVWIEESTRTLSADETTFGSAAVAEGATVTVANGTTWTGVAA